MTTKFTSNSVLARQVSGYCI